MTIDAFVSYPHSDQQLADAVVNTLEHDGVRCWIAPRAMCERRKRVGVTSRMPGSFWQDWKRRMKQPRASTPSPGGTWR